MSFYFAWSEACESFDPQRHARQDLKIFSVVIEAQEGGFPVARLRICKRSRGLGAYPNQQAAFLSYQKSEGSIELLFKGRLCQVPHHIEGESYEIHLTAEPLESQRQLQELHRRLQTEGLWDPLFASQEEQEDPRESLEARDCLFYWSRLGQPVRLSRLLQGRRILDIGSRFLRSSLDVRMGELPLAGVRVRLQASWQQTYRGRTDITYFLRSRFPGGLINTLTGQDLEARWWRENTRLGNSGYWIEESALKEMSAPYTGSLNVYPDQSRAFWVSPEDPVAEGYTAPFQSTLKRFWYRASLVLGWRYKQKRRESVDLLLRHDVQPLGPGLHKVRTLSFTIHGIDLSGDGQEWHPERLYPKRSHVVHQGTVFEALENHRSQRSFEADADYWRALGPKPHIPDAKSRSSFFTTPRGHQCVGHALDRARAHLAASSRAVEIRFSSDFETLSEISCDHSVVLEDDRLPGGKAQGKVTAYRLVAEGEKGIFKGEVTLACAVGPEKAERPPLVEATLAGEKEQEKQEQESYTEASYSPASFRCDRYSQSESGVTYQNFYDQGPRRGLTNPQLLTAHDLVEDVQISNGPDDQNAYLDENQYPQRHNISSVLQEVCTQIKVRLKDLRCDPVMTHQIHVTVPHPWSAPCHINLSADKRTYSQEER